MSGRWGRGDNCFDLSRRHECLASYVGLITGTNDPLGMYVFEHGLHYLHTNIIQTHMHTQLHTEISRGGDSSHQLMSRSLPSFAEN